MPPRSSPTVRTVSNLLTQPPLKQLHLYQNHPWSTPCPLLLWPPSQPRPPLSLSPPQSTSSVSAFTQAIPPLADFASEILSAAFGYSNGFPSRHYNTYGSRPKSPVYLPLVPLTPLPVTPHPVGPQLLGPSLIPPRIGYSPPLSCHHDLLPTPT